MATMSISGKEYTTGLVIFDKDGTLIDFRQTWLEIIANLIKTFGEYVPMTEALRLRIQGALGISVDTGTIDGSGPLAMGTFTECDALMAYCLYREGISWDKAQDLVRAVGDEVFRSDARNRCIRPVQGAIPLLSRLKDKGIHTAIATNDKAADAGSDMIAIGAAYYIDIIVGADSVENAKPAPDMVNKICDHFQVKPSSAVLIGDTVMDAVLGKNSGVGLTIGLPGIVSKEVLQDHMDVVVDSLDDIQ
jgi:phosphoglycolate phosphatase